MKIGINGFYLTTQFAGIGQYSNNLLHALAEIDKKNKYYVFTPEKVAWDFPPNFKQIVVPPFPFFKKSFIARFIWEEYLLAWAIYRHKIELFHALYQSLPYGSEKIATIVTIHDAIPWKFAAERKQMLYRWYSDIRKDLVVKRAGKVITISETSKVDFATIYGLKPEPIEVTYQSVDPIFLHSPTETEVADFKKKFKITNDFILYTGGLKRHKNLRILIKSFSILVKEYGYKGDLVILGAKRNNMAVSSHIYVNIEDLEKYAGLKKIGSRVKFYGYVSREDMSLFMHQAKCFVSLSLYEGFGLPAVEAMTSQTPSVLSNLSAYPEIAQNAALYVYPYGPHRIANAINQVLTVPALAESLKNKAKQRAQFFDRIKIAKRVLEIYQEVYDDYRINFQP